MNTPKFTPGPWEWCDSYSEYTDQKTQSLVGNDGYDSILCCDGESNSPPCLGETGEANAHLIAAAPDLYYELEKIIDYLEQERLIPDTDIAKAALSKARGEKQ